jgi:hypothetical protein
MYYCYFKQITYSIASSSAHEVDTYFNIIPTTGRINVKAALTGSNTVFYNVGILTTIILDWLIRIVSSGL